ncbi:hypothetical protein [Rhizobium wuzhouense]|uniref:Uncharacterized protein n=1 Tax=Rhizobium wuzhouense TaxID=1986026 RepID=A0ABX5NLQ0_9HYPH|nr:hypothetical protein [Rhizobium wuzhouense]PYB69635.1 hypothetical protein DMY87_23705 [Rhizobium wuzhouense]
MSPGIAIVALTAGLLSATMQAEAGDGPFVWNATKTGDTLKVRPGVALTVPGNLRLGLESALIAADPSGARTKTAPLAVWSEMDLPGRQAASTLGMRLDPHSGAGRAVLRQARDVSTGTNVDLSLVNAFEAGQRINGRSAFVARQELRLEFSDIGAALAGTAVLDNAAPAYASIKVEQQLPLGINLSATVSDLRTRPNAVFRAGLSGRW